MIFTIFDGIVVKKGSKPTLPYNSKLRTVPGSVDSANIIEVQQKPAKPQVLRRVGVFIPA